MAWQLPKAICDPSTLPKSIHPFSIMPHNLKSLLWHKLFSLLEILNHLPSKLPTFLWWCSAPTLPGNILIRPYFVILSPNPSKLNLSQASTWHASNTEPCVNFVLSPHLPRHEILKSRNFFLILVSPESGILQNAQ